MRKSQLLKGRGKGGLGRVSGEKEQEKPPKQEMTPARRIRLAQSFSVTETRKKSEMPTKGSLAYLKTIDGSDDTEQLAKGLPSLWKNTQL